MDITLSLYTSLITEKEVFSLNKFIMAGTSLALVGGVALFSQTATFAATSANSAPVSTKLSSIEAAQTTQDVGPNVDQQVGNQINDGSTDSSTVAETAPSSTDVSGTVDNGANVQQQVGSQVNDGTKDTGNETAQ